VFKHSCAPLPSACPQFTALFLEVPRGAGYAEGMEDIETTAAALARLQQAFEREDALEAADRQYLTVYRS